MRSRQGRLDADERQGYLDAIATGLTLEQLAAPIEQAGQANPLARLEAAARTANELRSLGDALLDQFGSEAGAEQVPGLGDRAVFEASGGLVFFSANGKVASVQVFKFGQPGSRDEVINLAKLLLTRLP